jgi:hypothetical protein
MFGLTMFLNPMRFLFVFFVFLAVALCASALPVGALPALLVDNTVLLAAGDGKGILPPDETAVPVPLVLAKPRAHLPLEPTGPHHGASSTLILSAATPLVALMVVLFFS